jgi:hypothetical protein
MIAWTKLRMQLKRKSIEFSIKHHLSMNETKGSTNLDKPIPTLVAARICQAMAPKCVRGRYTYSAKERHATARTL